MLGYNQKKEGHNMAKRKRHSVVHTRVTLDLIRDDYEMLQSLREIFGDIASAHVLRKALHLLNRFIKSDRRGAKVKICESDGTEEVLLILD